MKGKHPDTCNWVREGLRRVRGRTEVETEGSCAAVMTRCRQWNLKQRGNNIQRACIAMCSLFVCGDTEGRSVHCGSTDGVSTRSASSPFRCGGAHDFEKDKEVRKEATTDHTRTTQKVFGPVLVFVVYTGRNSADVDGCVPETHKCWG